MPSRPVLIGRGLVTHTPTKPTTTTTNVTNDATTSVEQTASTNQNLNQQTHPQNTPPRSTQQRVYHRDGTIHTTSEQVHHVTAAIAARETPGPIPNPEVKPASANGTAPDRMWESRTPPNIFFRRGHRTVAPSVHLHAASRLVGTACRPQALLRTASSTGLMGGSARSSVRPPRLARQEVTAMSTSETATERGQRGDPGGSDVPAGRAAGAAEWLRAGKFRVIVGRPPSPASRVTVDALDCVVWTKRPARAVAGWRTGDLVEVKGSLRRRFFAPTGGGRVSRCEVEVASAKLIRRADG